MDNTEHQLTDQYPKPKLYSIRGITIASALGTCLAGAILLSRNFTRLDRPEEARKAIVFGIVGCLAIIALIFLVHIPSNMERFATFMVEGLQVGAVALYANRGFAALSNEHYQGGGTFFSNWRAAGMAIPIGAIPLVVMFVGAVQFPNAPGIPNEDEFLWMVAYHDTKDMKDRGSITWDRMQHELQFYPWIEEFDAGIQSNGGRPAISVCNPHLDRFLAVEFVRTPEKQAFYCSWGRVSDEENYRTLGCDSISAVINLYHAFFTRELSQLDTLFTHVGNTPQELQSTTPSGTQ